jgi:ribosomal protein S18 acetylase RimI-like enzyme
MIRKAIKEDAKAIATLMVAAMEDLAKTFVGSAEIDDAVKLFEHFCGETQNQYSFENTLVYVVDDIIAGSITIYDGALIEELRCPFFEYIKANYHTNHFEMELESGAGELYIDTLSVNPNYQGKGIGQQLIMAAIDWGKTLGHQKIGLLVDQTNPNAKRLYERLGFIKENDKVLLGKPHEHLTYALKD